MVLILRSPSTFCNSHWDNNFLWCGPLNLFAYHSRKRRQHNLITDSVGYTEVETIWLTSGLSHYPHSAQPWGPYVCLWWTHRHRKHHHDTGTSLAKGTHFLTAFCSPTIPTGGGVFPTVGGVFPTDDGIFSTVGEVFPDTSNTERKTLSPFSNPL